MKIQPISTNPQTNFGALKVHKLNVKSRIKSKLLSDNSQEKNYLQAIMMALAFIAASFTKCIIDTCNNHHKAPAAVQVNTNQPQKQDSKTFQLK